jgi:4-diphosphocytidyl-2C-methyl-D-erythritol kinase
VVFALRPDLGRLLRKLKRLGANPAMMTGSGSALFGFVSSAVEARQISQQFPPSWAHPVRFVSRGRYRAAWHRALGEAAAVSVFGSEFKQEQGARYGKGLLD